MSRSLATSVGPSNDPKSPLHKETDVPASPTRRPRVLFLGHSGVLGGGELSLLDIAADWTDSSSVTLLEDGPFVARLKERGISTHVLSAPSSLQQVRRSAGLLSLLTTIPGVVRQALRLVPYARDADLLYANSQKAMVFAAIAGWWTRKPVVWHLRDILSNDHFSPGNRLLATLLANTSVHTVICNSEATREAFVQTGGSRRRCIVIPNGIDPRPFQYSSATNSMETFGARQATRDQIRVANHLPVDAPVVGVFSRIASWKGQLCLVEALPSLPGIHALIVGDALFEADRAYEERLLDRIRELRISDRVHLLGFRDDVPALMRAVDVVAHTSTAPEPFGRVIVEGMMACRPVVATRAGGAVEIVEHGRTGLLVSPGDPEDLASVLRELTRNKVLASRIAQDGSAHAHRHYSVNVLLRRIRRLILDVTSKRV